MQQTACTACVIHTNALHFLTISVQVYKCKTQFLSKFLFTVTGSWHMLQQIGRPVQHADLKLVAVLHC